MANLNIPTTRELLQRFDFESLFIEELGWDRHSASLQVTVGDQTFNLHAVAEKRGLGVFLCDPLTDGSIPDYPTRRKIETQVAKSVHQHIIIYVDRNKTAQVWQWVRREIDRPTACRERTYHVGQSGEPLIQRLEGIAFSLEEEEALTHIDVTGRVRATFDVDKITKRFYDRFKTEHDVFMKFVDGIPDKDMQRWYASVMINRLMFIYFIQKKGFLDGNQDYLRSKLAETKKRGKNCFYSEFLCALFFKGFAEKDRSPETKRLLGEVPYLNGGLFLRHQIEELAGEKIDIADSAFEKLFDFFDAYHWHLDERPLRNDREINPDVLGYIFEKYINQKQMGAYYTKEDITEYISKNTIIPCLFDKARQKCKIAFEGDASVWRLLQEDPDRYIYKAVRHGVTWDVHTDKPLAAPLPLPPEIEEGIDTSRPNLLERRKAWNRPAPPEYALPTEIWREVVARRQRYEEVRSKLASGEAHEINDLITYNLDIRQFAQDVITNSEGPELLRAFWHTIVGRIPEKSNEKFENGTSILDPTCGSGAFLFAALNILEPLYDACLDRMQAFLDDLERSGEKHDPKKFNDFRKVLERVEKHPNHRYFVLKSIIVNNLFGVDIMEEAVEICKLRMFLKLVAQVERGEQIEPLPDIDFNIRCGNTLVGYATYDEVRRAVTSKLDFENAMGRVEEKAQDIGRLFDLFRQQQTELNGEVTPADKQELRNRLKTLEDELNTYLASECGIDPNKKARFESWLESHKPFHWFIEFHEIMASGGFDVVMGNPPYVETKGVSDYRVISYVTETCGNLYPLCVERSSKLLSRDGGFGMIVPLSGFSTSRMRSYQNHLCDRYELIYASFYSGDAHPSVMFNGVKYRLSVIVGRRSRTTEHSVYTTNYMRWYSDERPYLFSLLYFTKCPFRTGYLRFAKLGNPLFRGILEKLVPTTIPLGAYMATSGTVHVNYHRSPVFWIRSMDFEPYFKSSTKERSTDHIRDLYFRSVSQARRIGAILNSTLFYSWFTTQGNCRNVTEQDVSGFPTGDLDSSSLEDAENAFERLMRDLRRNSKRRVYNYEHSGRVEYDEFYPNRSKTIIDEIDRALAKHHGFTEEELDFIVNYDIKYRMGRDAEQEEQE